MPIDYEMDAETLELGVRSAKVASLVALTQIASIIISGVMVLVLARLLQPTLYGIYTLAYSISMFFSAFGMSGIGHYLNKYIPMWVARRRRKELERDLGASFAVVFAISVVAVLIGVSLSGFVSAYVFHSASYIPLVDLALLSIVFAPLMYLSYNALIGFRDGIGSAITYSVGNLVIAAASIILVLLGYGAFGAIAGLIIGSVVGIIAGAFFILKHSAIRLGISDLGQRAVRILAFSLPVASSTILQVLMNSFSILFLGVFSSAVIIGSFGVSYRIGTIVVTAVGFISSVLVQMFASALEGRKSAEKVGKLYNYSIYFGAVLTVPVAVYLIVLSRAFVNALFPAYTSSLLYTPAVVISLLVGMIGIYASSLAISTGRVNKVLKYAVVTTIAQLALLLVLVPLVNAYGVILATYLGGSVVSNWLFVRYMRKEFRIRTELGKVYRVVLAGFLLALLLVPAAVVPRAPTVQLVAGVLAIMVLYPPLLGITGAMRSDEIKLLRAIGTSTPGLGSVVSVAASYISIFAR